MKVSGLNYQLYGYTAVVTLAETDAKLLLVLGRQAVAGKGTSKYTQKLT